MADARALLRAHRAENRIRHPHAAYSDAGKLLCKLCHESVKSESLWDGHIRNQSHRKKLQALQKTATPPQETSGPSKRKHDDVDDSMSDADGDDPEELIRKKRSRTDVGGHGGERERDRKEKTGTPPLLSRRSSHPPGQGVEIAIPSRPATPAAGSNSATSTPKAAPIGRSPLIGSDTMSTPTSTSTPTTQQATLPISTQSLTVPSTTSAAPITTSNSSITITTTSAGAGGAAVDEAEWAAFEAEIASAEQAPAPSASYSADATISAPAMTAAQVVAKSREEENERRKHLLDAQIADEREDATRALEAEFEEMEELEGRVRRLKERREELRKGSVANLRGVSATPASVPTSGVKSSGAADGKENNSNSNAQGDEDEDEDEEDEDDDWDAFRFR
ncbi:hypothetical protein AAE478_007654 [Parahypoxylon ruwenzoriense]